MMCPYCNSKKIRTLKVHILNPIRWMKHLCLECNKNFITHRTKNDNPTESQYKNINK